jgi:hypothetical protein
MNMPIKEINKLKEILESVAYAEPGDPHSCCFIKESARDAKLKKVEIRGLGLNSLIIYPEKGQGSDKRYSPILKKNPDSHHNKACDAVILCTKNGKHYLILCELKSGRPSGFNEQFKATACFISYLRHLVYELYNCPVLERKTRHIVLNLRKHACQTLDKKPVSFKKTASPESEVHFVHIHNDAKIDIAQLIAS